MFNRRIKAVIDGQLVEIKSNVIDRHDKTLPRYTSYPPIPSWSSNVGHEEFADVLMRSCSDALSLYVHLPFCRKRCNFCACQAIATTKTEIIDRYMDALIKEMELILKYLDPCKIKLESMHWGGGTPTYLNAKQMDNLNNEIRKRFEFCSNAEIGIEIDPWQINVERLEMIKELGFNRVSFGIQDTNPKVLKECGRDLDLDHAKDLMDAARRFGFKGINIDLCYGLPYQTQGNFNNTIHDVIKLKPDRISLFNFAYLPQIFPHQRKIKRTSIPSAFKKIQMFTKAIHQLGLAGYQFIGLDHFAKNDDELTKAKLNGTLKRTFQGYTTRGGCDLLGIGITAISQLSNLYAQNEKKLASYFNAIEGGRLAIRRGHKFTKDDLIRSWVMQKIFCHQLIDKGEFSNKWEFSFDEYFKEICLDHLIAEELIEDTHYHLKILPIGRIFIRNIACVFDKYFAPETLRYSKAL